MIHRDKAPETRIRRIVPVITHHPVVVHPEGIGGCDLSVNKDGAVLDLQIITLVSADDFLVERDILMLRGTLAPAFGISSGPKLSSFQAKFFPSCGKIGE